MWITYTFTKNKSRYISNVVIGRNEQPKNTEAWFNADIPINPGLVAIIGNKGSGKSALSDIIGYLCHCSSINQASFLSKERFQREDKKFAADYHGEITWADNHKIIEGSLYSIEDNSIIEYAKYLPQKYIESVCSNLGNEFQDEVNKIIQNSKFEEFDIRYSANEAYPAEVERNSPERFFSAMIIIKDEK